MQILVVSGIGRKRDEGRAGRKDLKKTKEEKKINQKNEVDG